MNQKRYSRHTKKKRSIKQTPTRGANNSRFFVFIGLGLILAITMLVIIVRSMFQPNSYAVTAFQKAQSWYVAKKPAPVVVKKDKKPAPLPEDEPIQFEFYSTLANSDAIVKVDPDHQDTTRDKKKL